MGVIEECLTSYTTFPDRNDSDIEKEKDVLALHKEILNSSLMVSVRGYMVTVGYQGKAMLIQIAKRKLFWDTCGLLST
jgi:hypothetical protein